MLSILHTPVNVGLPRGCSATIPLTLSGNTANTFTGTTYVTQGTLKLESTQAIVGPLYISYGGVVDAKVYAAINAPSLTITGGTLKLHGTQHAIGTLHMTGGMVKNGVVGTAEGMELHDAQLENVAVFVSSEGMQIAGASTVEMLGHIVGDSVLSSDSTLRVGGVGTPGSGVQFTDGLHAQAGATLELLPAAVDQPALVQIDGGLLVGEHRLEQVPIPPFGSIPTLAGMNGVAKVDLSQSEPLAAGVYNLIDFGQTPYEFSPYPGSVYAKMQNFNTIAPPDTEGNFRISGRVLQFVSEGPQRLPGDYNDDGMVTLADYSVWRDNLGGSTALPNDETPGVGVDDYDRWKGNFGQVASGTAAPHTGTGQPVPEPTTALLLAAGLAAGAVCQRQRPHRLRACNATRVSTMAPHRRFLPSIDIAS